MKPRILNSRYIFVRAATYAMSLASIASLIAFILAGAYLSASLALISVVLCGLGLIVG